MKKFYIIFVFIIFTLFVFSWGMLTIQKKIFPYIQIKLVKDYFQINNSTKSESTVAVNKKQEDKKWVKNVINGGYILHFRHAEREKWALVNSFELFALKQEINVEGSSFERATCLTSKGIEEAKLIGNVFTILNIKIQRVYSSPSCRALQTAKYAFNKVDITTTALLGKGVVKKHQYEDFGNKLRRLFDEIKIEKGKNIILSGHRGTLITFVDKVIDVNEVEGLDNARDETGFTVLEKVGNKIFARYQFKNFNDFATIAIEIPLN